MKTTNRIPKRGTVAGKIYDLKEDESLILFKDNYKRLMSEISILMNRKYIEKVSYKKVFVINPRINEMKIGIEIKKVKE